MISGPRSYCKGKILGIRLILAGREGNQPVESSGASTRVFCRGACTCNLRLDMELYSPDALSLSLLVVGGEENP